MAPTDAKLTSAEVRHRAKASVVATVVRGVSVRLLGFAGNVALARMLSPHDFGVLAIGLSLTAIGLLLANGGFAASLISRARPPTQHELASVLGFQIVLATCLIAAIAAISSPFGRNGMLVTIMATGLWFDSARVSKTVLYERNVLYAPIARIAVSEIAFYNICAVALVVSGTGIWGVAIASPLRAMFGLTLLAFVPPRGLTRPRWSFPVIRSIWASGAAFQGAQLMTQVRDQALNFTIPIVAGATTLGLYSLVYRLLQPVIVVLESFWTVAFPATARLLETGEDIRPPMERGLASGLLVVGVAVVFIGGTSPALLPLLFGPDWSDAADCLSLCVVSVMASGPLASAAIGYLFAANRSAMVVRVTACQTVGLLAVSLPLLPLMGVTGVGIGFVVAAAVDIVAYGFTLQRSLGMRIWRLTGQIMLLILAGTGTARLVMIGLPIDVLSLLIAAAVGEIVYLGGTLLFKRREASGAINLALSTLRAGRADAPVASSPQSQP